MRFFKLHDDEIIVTDGKITVLIMARGGGGFGTRRFANPTHVELESYQGDTLCDGCDMNTIFLRELNNRLIHWRPCDGCPKEIRPS